MTPLFVTPSKEGVQDRRLRDLFFAALLILSCGWDLSFMSWISACVEMTRAENGVREKYPV